MFNYTEIEQHQVRASASSPTPGPWLVGAEPHPGRLARACIRSQQDIVEVEKFAPEQLLPGATIYECIKASAAANPSKPAMIQLVSADLTVAPRVITYGKLVQSIEQAANLFVALSEGERPAVSIILPMVQEALIATWAGATAGIANPINPYLETRVVISIMNAARTTVLVTTTNKHGPGIWDKLGEIRSQVPTLRRVLIVDADDPAIDFTTAVEAAPVGRLTFEPTTDPHAEAVYLPTGGTTAAPKLVRMTHRGQLLNAWIAGAMSGATAEGVVGHAMPNFHIGGLGVLALRAILFGQTLLTLTKDGFRNPEVIKNFWDIARRYRISSVLAVPATAAAILSVPDAQSEGHCIQTFNCGASTVPVELMRGFHERFGIWLREFWGMSEIHGIVTAHPNEGGQPVVGSVGCHLPYHPVMAIEVDAANRFVRVCATGERGVLAVTGPGVTGGYVDPRLDAEFFVAGMTDGKKWANTGDLGCVDANDYAWLFGRSKDLIIRGGHNIDPKLIEDVLVCHPEVQIAAAVGRPDQGKGEMPIAYVQLKPGAQASSAELLQFCRERVQERAAMPSDIIIIAEIPMTAVGKISKPALRIVTMCALSRKLVADLVGERGSVEVSVDESGLRPMVVLQVRLVSGDAAQVEALLKEIFRNYEFATSLSVLKIS